MDMYNFNDCHCHDFLPAARLRGGGGITFFHINRGQLNTQEIALLQ